MKATFLLPFLLLGVAACGSGKRDANAIDPNDQEAVMARYMELATPDAHHAMLEPLVGQFRCEVTMWDTPDGEPQVNVGTSTHRWILGGRFVEQAFNGTFMNMPFEGQGFTGYDKVREAYVGFWIDSFGTQMTDVSVGQASEDGRSIEFRREMLDPIQGGSLPLREVLTFVDDRHIEMDMYMPDSNGKEFRTMHIAYTRR